MRRRLFWYTMLIILAGLLCFFGAAVYGIYLNNYRIAEDSVIETAHICAGLYNNDSDLSVFVGAGGDTRITVISSDGSVLADSGAIAYDTSSAHLDRPEIQAALGGSPAAFTRYSASLGIDLIYYALMVYTGDDDYVFIRTALPVERVEAYMSQFLPLLIIVFTIIAALCFILSNAMISRITKPLENVKEKLAFLSEGQYSKTPPTGDYEEIDAIVSEIDDVARILQENIAALSEEKSKVEYILNNVNDGIFALDAASDIVHINKAAQDIFGVTSDITGKSLNYLTCNEVIAGAVTDCADNGKFTLSEFLLNGRYFTVTANRPEGTKLTIVVMSDITDSRESAKQREEFFENASHELKTPLTAIRGFGELCMMNNKDEKLGKYIDGISRETDRMLALIKDMLKLSELSGLSAGMDRERINPVTVPLHDTANDVLGSLTAAVNDAGVTVDITGECSVSVDIKHAYMLLKNLMENAVTYNVPGGNVRVIFDSCSLKVEDTGIGIPYEDQARLFERFYRVDKSRSANSGGTGLGLAIVKHICAIYDWDLSLKSRPGVGTEVAVVFK